MCEWWGKFGELATGVHRSAAARKSTQSFCLAVTLSSIKIKSKSSFTRASDRRLVSVMCQRDTDVVMTTSVRDCLVGLAFASANRRLKEAAVAPKGAFFLRVSAPTAVPAEAGEVKVYDSKNNTVPSSASSASSASLFGFMVIAYRGNLPIRNWHHEKYHLLSLKIRERVGPKSPLIS